jgi:hypothetical protein
MKNKKDLDRKECLENWHELKSKMSRRDWNGINPTTKVKPSKKHPKKMRKLKHKGRKFDPFFVPGSQLERPHKNQAA